MLPLATAGRWGGSPTPAACRPNNIFRSNSIISNSPTTFTRRCSSLPTNGCRAAEQRQQRPRRQSSTSRPSPNNQKKKRLFRARENVALPVIDGHESPGDVGLRYRPSALPKPPAGFVLDSHGRVLMASSKRIATMVNPTCSSFSLNSFFFSNCLIFVFGKKMRISCLPWMGNRLILQIIYPWSASSGGFSKAHKEMIVCFYALWIRGFPFLLNSIFILHGTALVFKIKLMHLAIDVFVMLFLPGLFRY